jgi:hypothetical protein
MLEHRVFGALSGNLSFPRHCCTDEVFSQAAKQRGLCREVISHRAHRGISNQIKLSLSALSALSALWLLKVFGSGEMKWDSR